MKRILGYILFAVICCSCSSSVMSDRVVVAYVTSWGSSLPNPRLMTHINYAFGKVSDSFDMVDISNPDRLKDIVALKKKNRKLKVMLSIGGWGAGNFSEMAASDELREKFCESCLKAVEQYRLDGIDIDWEYPSSSSAGISSSDEDTENFTLLIRDLREVLGEYRTLTLASVASAEYVNFPDFIDCIDFVNLMTYDMGWAPCYNSALFRSEPDTGLTVDEAVTAHLEAGVPSSKIVVGMPFYGHGDKVSFGSFVDYKDIVIDTTLFRECWDEVARVPYVTDTAGKIVFTYDNVESISEKCKYVLDRSFHGAMYWEAGADNADQDLSRKIAEMIL